MALQVSGMACQGLDPTQLALEWLLLAQLHLYKTKHLRYSNPAELAAACVYSVFAVSCMCVIICCFSISAVSCFVSIYTKMTHDHCCHG